MANTEPRKARITNTRIMESRISLEVTDHIHKEIGHIMTFAMAIRNDMKVNTLSSILPKNSPSFESSSFM
ncbi:hypothetical protein [Cytobacillus firmus]|uniref:hypothetical protein n=1 Tax=Cytobacillus firmus TaxID=1399 RepID=UPI002162CAD1|nr:hypothetical protein [Cytobacillus firmus]